MCLREQKQSKPVRTDSAVTLPARPLPGAGRLHPRRSKSSIDAIDPPANLLSTRRWAQDDYIRGQLGPRSTIAAVYSAAAFLARPVLGAERLDSQGADQALFDRHSNKPLVHTEPETGRLYVRGAEANRSHLTIGLVVTLSVFAMRVSNRLILLALNKKR